MRAIAMRQVHSMVATEEMRRLFMGLVVAGGKKIVLTMLAAHKLRPGRGTAPY